MLLNDEDKASNKNLQQLEEYGSRKIPTEVLEKKLDLTLYWKRFGKQEAPTKGTRPADRERT